MRLYNEKETNDNNILLYGAPGSGKTYLASTIAKNKKTLLFDIDLGAGTLDYMSKEIKDNIVALQYTKFSDVNDIYQMLKINKVEEWNKFFKSKGLDITIKKPFEVLILDSLSELQRQMEIELSSSTFANKMRKPQDIKPLRIQDWGALSNMTETIVADAFGVLPIIFIATAHEQLIENEFSGEVMGTPKIRGKLAMDIGKHFDFMGRLAFARSGQRVMYTTGQNNWQSKSRKPLDDVVINPKITDII